MRICRKLDRREAVELEVALVDGEVIVERRGRRQVLHGALADQVRRALEAGDETTMQRLLK